MLTNVRCTTFCVIRRTRPCTRSRTAATTWWTCAGRRRTPRCSPPPTPPARSTSGTSTAIQRYVSAKSSHNIMLLLCMKVIYINKHAAIQILSADDNLVKPIFVENLLASYSYNVLKFELVSRFLWLQSRRKVAWPSTAYLGRRLALTLQLETTPAKYGCTNSLR